MDSATLGQRWSDFRRWRRGRPFWSGLLLILSGIELWLSSNMDLGALEVHLGYEGFLSYVLPTVLLLCGVFVWFSPNQRIFYGIIGGLTAIFSLVGLNLGGWFVGMLIGVVGGALAFAWAPLSTVDQPASGGAPADRDTDNDTDFETGYDAGTVVRTPSPRHGRDDNEEEPPASPGGSSLGSAGRLLAIVIPVLLLAGGLAVAAAPPSQAATAAPCATTTNAAPAAVAPNATPSPSPTRAPTLLELWIEFWERLFGKDAPKPTAFPTTPPPTVAPTASPSPTCDPTAPGTNPTDPGTGAPTGSGTGGPGDPGASSASPSPSVAPAPRLAAADGQPVVSDHPGHMTTSVLTLNGFAFDGVVELPTTGGGTIRVLQFSIARATNADFRLLIEKDGQTLAITSDPLIAAGNVKLYTSRFTGSLLGIPLTFTPDFPPPLTLPDMIFTNVSLELVFLDCDTLEGPSLFIS
jgi:Family of unknown function (DUF6114)